MVKGVGGCQGESEWMPHWFYTYFVHALSGNGYQFWSGIGSDLGEVTLLGIVLVWWHNHNCHVHRCWRLSWHPSPRSRTPGV
jgi:hypothetical protein